MAGPHIQPKERSFEKTYSKLGGETVQHHTKRGKPKTSSTLLLALSPLLGSRLSESIGKRLHTYNYPDLTRAGRRPFEDAFSTKLNIHGAMKKHGAAAVGITSPKDDEGYNARLPVLRQMLHKRTGVA